ncbi:hypothetical protein GGQ85_000750 [Nitrobacter vulgaris]|uniref:hypothetical protein n=1 Tax=Nitrobacter vulgaris TaxID=29421 RepID=UPI0028577145|nr:hypothetical protein [Nitrobacter vulgaris]MDR6303069.1 hypothetical protein [Nitrobacter vulgaris]
MSDHIDIEMIPEQCHEVGNISPLLRALCPDLSDDATQFLSDRIHLNPSRADPTTKPRHEAIADFIEAYDRKKTRRGFDRAAFDAVYPQYKALPGGKTLMKDRAETLVRGERPKEVREILRQRRG